ncbi:MAG: Smr/MutS family protein [Halocynthiibacter sp.]
MSRKKRTLKASEKELWDQVAQTAVPLERPKAKLQAPIADTKPKPPVKERAPIASFTMSAKAKLQHSPHYQQPSLSDRLKSAAVHMDQKTHRKLKRGKLSPEGKIDLHGMTQDRAHSVLTSFILRAASEEKRLVLVITGKGKMRDEGGPIPEPIGVLRHRVPQWLHAMPLAPHVLQITESHLKHGGSGAFYVYLRRRRERR